MRLPVLTLFNNKGGVGKTSLIYHLAWMFASLEKKVVAVDLDPQANLTSAFLEEEKVEQIWNSANNAATIFQAVQPLQDVGDLVEPNLQDIDTNLSLIPGDMSLSRFEDTLSTEWPMSMNSTNLYRPLRILTSFWQIIQKVAKNKDADLILVDIGPNLGAINRSVLIATNYVIIPLGADLFSLQGLRNLGPTLKIWREDWQRRVQNWNKSNERSKHPDFDIPEGKMEVLGYLCQQYSVRLDRQVQAYDKWINRIPMEYRTQILDQQSPQSIATELDPFCMATIKHYRSLVPMGHEHRKPIFSLTAADGAIGSHQTAVQHAREDFRELAIRIGNKIGLQV